MKSLNGGDIIVESNSMVNNRVNSIMDTTYKENNARAEWRWILNYQASSVF